MIPPVDLDEVRRRSAELREAEREAEAWARHPLLVNVAVYHWYVLRAAVLTRWWRLKDLWFSLVTRAIFAREYLRDAYLVARGRPLYVRCAHFCGVLRPCRRDATVAMSADGMPILCPEHADPPRIPGETDVGRWLRAPQWERRLDARRRLVRPARENTG